MNDIGDIKTAINSFKSDTAFMQLQTRWNRDFDLYRLKPYNAGRGYYSYTSNSPRVLADKLVSMLVDASLMIHVPEDLLTVEEAKVANNVERFLYGCLNINDEIYRRMINMPSLREQLAWYSIVRGGFAVRVYTYKNDKGETIPEIRVWDLYNVAYGEDEDGNVSWASHTYQLSPQTAKARFGKKVGGATEVTDFWDTEKYGVLVNNQWADGTVSHGLGYCPVYIFRVGATPAIWQNNYEYTSKYQGESAFAANRDLYPIFNKTISDLLTMVRRGVKVPLGFWSQGGKKTIDEDIWQVEKASVVQLDTTDKVEPLFKETAPPDMATLLNLVSGDVQRGGLANTAYGELGFRLSGFAINQLQQALGTVIMPHSYCLEKAYTCICESLIQQYTRKGNRLPPIKVRGRTSKNVAFGYPRAEIIKASNIKGDWHPELKLEPVLPKDDAQRYQLARLAREGEIPLLSDETIRGEFLGVRDPDLEKLKIDNEWADSIIINRLWKAYIGAVEEEGADSMKAANVLAQLKMLMTQTGIAPTSQRPNAPSMTATEKTAMGSPGVGMPARKTGVPASTVPPEMSGGMPPGAQNARMPPFSEEA